MLYFCRNCSLPIIVPFKISTLTNIYQIHFIFIYKLLAILTFVVHSDRCSLRLVVN